EQGLNVNDIILSVNGERVTAAAGLLEGKKPGEKLSIRLLREGLERSLEVVAGPNENASYKFEKLDGADKQQQANYKAWLAL
ncbi:MAG TPA: hypothetical protein VD772_06365, partial [Anseongella sp.]|nr:hypothetical protein [Anseongella sp.]